MDPNTGADRKALEEALLAFQLMPGQYSLALREPPLLFSAMTQVLQVASGRCADAAPSPMVQQAACFFIRSALLQPGADHYTVLGLGRGADAPTIKEHYRLLMRLMHPDFADGAGRSPWPSDAAARVNRAYEVLTSAVQRRAYDSQLDEDADKAKPRQPEPAAKLRTASAVRRATQPAPADRRRPLKRLAGVFGAVGTFALLGLVLGTGSEKEMLIKRASQPIAQPAPPDSPPLSNADTTAALEAPPELRTAPVAPAAPRIDLQPARQLAAAVPPSTSVAAQPVRTEAMAASRQAALAHRKDGLLPAVAPLEPNAAAVPGNAATAAPRLATTESIAAAPLAAMPEGRAALPFVAAERTMPNTAATAPRPSLTLAEAHPVLTKVLQQLETGRGDGLLGLLERDARNTPSAQALMRNYAGLVEGSRPIRIANAHFRAEPREGRLLVTGNVLIQVGDAAPAKELAMQAEFVSRDGAVVMTRLAPAPTDKVQ